MIDPDDDGPKISDDLRGKLFPENPPEQMIEVPSLPGECPIHGKVGFARFILHDTGKILSEHCAKCVSKVLIAIVGELVYPDEKD